MDRANDELPASSDRAATVLVGWLLGPVFLGLAAWFVLASSAPSVPATTAAEVSKEWIKPGPRRVWIGDPPSTVIGGYSHRCNDCHRLFGTPPRNDANLMQHMGVELRHGMNNRCFNCHDERNRELLVLMDGTTLPFAETPRVCAQCHGTLYRDWQDGTHGKTMGSWDATGGGQRRLHCNECHDPHAPAYEPLKPLPGPNTLRMGEQTGAHGHEGKRSPLQAPAHAEPPAGHGPGGDGGTP